MCASKEREELSSPLHELPVVVKGRLWQALGQCIMPQGVPMHHGLVRDVTEELMHDKPNPILWQAHTFTANGESNGH